MTAKISHLPIARLAKPSIVRKLSFLDISPRFKKILVEWQKVQNSEILKILENTTVCPPNSIIFDQVSGEIVHPETIQDIEKQMIYAAVHTIDNDDQPSAVTIRGTKPSDRPYSAILMPIKKSPRGTIIIVLEGSCEI